MLLALALGACSSNNDTVAPQSSCANLTGNFNATAFTATGTSNATLTNNFLANGGAFTLGFTNGSFNSSFKRSATDTARVAVNGTSTVSGNTLTLGTTPLFAGAPSGSQMFTCTLTGNTLTLTNTNSLFMFPGDSIPRPSRFDITLTKTS